VDSARLGELLAPLGLGGFSALGISVAAGEPGAFAFLGESLTPLGSCGSYALGTFSTEFRLGGLPTFGFSLLLPESIAVVSSSIFCGVLRKT
jgi:hypothetical protein